MRFLFINQYYAPDYAATAQLLQDLCEALAKLGHEVHVLAGDAVYDGRPLALPPEETINGVHVHRVAISNKGRGRFRDRFLGYLSFYTRAFAKINFLPKPDVVITLTTPPLISLLGTWMRVFYRSRFVYWLMDIYPDIAIKAQVLSRVGPVRTMWSALGRASYLTANKVVVLGHDMKDVLERKSVAGHKIEVIPCWADGEDIHPVPVESNAFAAEHKTPGRFTLMYSGNMGTCHSFDAAIKGIQKLDGEGRFEFQFVGGGKQKSRLAAALEGLESVKFLPYQDRAVLPESLSSADAHLITLQSAYDGLLLPSKIYGILAAAKPVIFVGGADSEIARMVRSAGCGLVVSEDDAEGFAAALRELADDPEEAAAMGRRGRRWFERHYARDRTVTRFALLLEQQGLIPGVRGVRILADKTLALVTPNGAVREEYASLVVES